MTPLAAGLDRVEPGAAKRRQAGGEVGMHARQHPGSEEGCGEGRQARSAPRGLLETWFHVAFPVSPRDAPDGRFARLREAFDLDGDDADLVLLALEIGRASCRERV